MGSVLVLLLLFGAICSYQTPNEWCVDDYNNNAYYLWGMDNCKNPASTCNKHLIAEVVGLVCIHLRENNHTERIPSANGCLFNDQ